MYTTLLLVAFILCIEGNRNFYQTMQPPKWIKFEEITHEPLPSAKTFYQTNLPPFFTIVPAVSDRTNVVHTFKPVTTIGPAVTTPTTKKKTSRTSTTKSTIVTSTIEKSMIKTSTIKASTTQTPTILLPETTATTNVMEVSSEFTTLYKAGEFENTSAGGRRVSTVFIILVVIFLAFIACLSCMAYVKRERLKKRRRQTFTKVYPV